MHPLIRHLNAALLIALSVTSARAEDDLAARQAEYQRLHDSAVAFAKTVEVSGDRYANLRTVDLERIRRLIAQSEQAAQARQFDAASAHARQAYEMLRGAITGAVAEEKKRGGN